MPVKGRDLFGNKNGWRPSRNRNWELDASVNYRKKMRMSAENLLGVTPEMRKRDLLWVYRCMRIKVDRSLSFLVSLKFD
ncbi:hypothetical protein CCACVL1_27984 [Corchorus capsularis]|uniref:Uncharacterized protein n=1 Tax=Corchorus capsularis TaxID=210143 RepID=A0A1R3G815_COCAP|nr:hypothetical protein CCACVL1_27984 [Corchorus capsularis]